MELAGIAQTASQKVKEFLDAQNFDRQGGNMDAHETGRFRKRVREYMSEEMSEIEKIIAEILSQ